MKHLDLKFKKRLVSLGVLSLLALSACGGASHQEPDRVENTPNPILPGKPDDDRYENFAPVEVHSLQAFGGDLRDGSGPRLRIKTDNILKLKFDVGTGTVQNFNNGEATNTHRDYQCVNYTILIDGVHRVSTGKLGSKGNPYCPDAPQSKILDLSHRIGDRGDRDIRIQIVGADNNGRAYDDWSNGFYVSPSKMETLFYLEGRKGITEDMMKVSIEVQTNGTQPL
jgi:hypothetical protein